MNKFKKLVIDDLIDRESVKIKDEPEELDIEDIDLLSINFRKCPFNQHTFKTGDTENLVGSISTKTKGRLSFTYKLKYNENDVWEIIKKNDLENITDLTF